VEETDMDVEEAIFKVNYFGLVSLTRAILPHMLQRKSGQFVVVSSVAGKFAGVPCSSSYAATKHALQGYFDTLRAELSEHGITVTMACPGPIKSNIGDHVFGTSVRSRAAGVSTPLMRCTLRPGRCQTR
jgi:dehydrogenase/reductase SDR family member 7B